MMTVNTLVKNLIGVNNIKVNGTRLEATDNGVKIIVEYGNEALDILGKKEPY